MKRFLLSCILLLVLLTGCQKKEEKQPEPPVVEKEISPSENVVNEVMDDFLKLDLASVNEHLTTEAKITASELKGFDEMKRVLGDEINDLMHVLFPNAYEIINKEVISDTQEKIKVKLESIDPEAISKEIMSAGIKRIFDFDFINGSDEEKIKTILEDIKPKLNELNTKIQELEFDMTLIDNQWEINNKVIEQFDFIKEAIVDLGL